jgi:hypothetical protein
MTEFEKEIEERIQQTLKSKQRLSVKLPIENIVGPVIPMNTEDSKPKAPLTTKTPSQNAFAFGKELHSTRSPEETGSS